MRTSRRGHHENVGTEGPRTGGFIILHPEGPRTVHMSGSSLSKPLIHFDEAKFCSKRFLEAHSVQLFMLVTDFCVHHSFVVAA